MRINEHCANVSLSLSTTICNTIYRHRLLQLAQIIANTKHPTTINAVTPSPFSNNDIKMDLFLSRSCLNKKAPSVQSARLGRHEPPPPNIMTLISLLPRWCRSRGLTQMSLRPQGRNITPPLNLRIKIDPFATNCRTAFCLLSILSNIHVLQNPIDVFLTLDVGYCMSRKE